MVPGHPQPPPLWRGPELGWEQRLGHRARSPEKNRCLGSWDSGRPPYRICLSSTWGSSLQVWAGGPQMPCNFPSICTSHHPFTELGSIVG